MRLIVSILKPILPVFVWITSALASAWPSVSADDLGTPVLFVSRLECPARTFVNASRSALRLTAHDSGGRMARYALAV